MPPNLWDTESQDKYNGKVKTTLDNLSKPNLANSVSGDNPLFIWPGATTHDLGTLNGKYKPLRGYIRRLNEFYKNMGLDTSTISNRKCNFQFQPETVVRSVVANSSDTQYFFNQDPGQLTVPIPGQSNFNIKLLFNREAEVRSNRYLGGNGKLRTALGTRPSPSIDDDKDSLFASGEFDPGWVTKIGVLADILVLDAVIGQGINNETVNIIRKIADQAAAEAAKNAPAEGTTLTDKQLDEQDKNKLAEEATKFWIGATGANPNLGNQAFLVPTPVRIVLSNNMMVEGFVLQSSVNFHKFSREFIPTQATVELSVQALYIGFAKKTTMLTQPQETTDENGPDKETKKDQDIAVEKATLEGISSFYQGVLHHKGGKDLLNYILKPDPQQSFNFQLGLSPEGVNYRFNTLAQANGGEPSFEWSGKIFMYWDSFMSGTSNSRQPTRTSASGGTLLKGCPAGFEHWGVVNNQRVIATGSGIIYEDLPQKWRFETNSSIFHIIGSTGSLLSSMEEALWDMNLPAASSPRPFEQDKFTVGLEITLTLRRFDVAYPVGQKIVFNETVTCNDDVLFKKLTLAKQSQQ